jgi:hypothetical protein
LQEKVTAAKHKLQEGGKKTTHYTAETKEKTTPEDSSTFKYRMNVWKDKIKDKMPGNKDATDAKYKA